MAAHAPEKVPCGPEWELERRRLIPHGPGVAVFGGRFRLWAVEVTGEGEGEVEVEVEVGIGVERD